MSKSLPPFMRTGAAGEAAARSKSGRMRSSASSPPALQTAVPMPSGPRPLRTFCPASAARTLARSCTMGLPLS
eukprot:10086563-Lingulodinium_polyedra.AAC.1